MSNLKTDPAPDQTDRQYLEFDLDAETLAIVEKLAEKEGVTTFEMCAILMHERLAELSGGSDLAGRIRRESGPGSKVKASRD